MPFEIAVAADAGAAEPELLAIADAFKRAGFDVRPEATVSRRSGGPWPWIVSVTLGAPIATFFTTFAKNAADDAYPLVKRWVKELWAARAGAGSGTGSIDVQDDRGSTLVLSSTLPDDALDALRDLDWAQLEGDYLLWSESRHQWLDPMKHPSAF